jgi:TonB family protein
MNLARPVLAFCFCASALNAQVQHAGWEIDTSHAFVGLSLSAINPDTSSHAVTPVLIVRCRNSELQLYLATWSALAGDSATPVEIRWGTAAPQEVAWVSSQDHTGVFAPEPQTFLTQLLTSPDLSFEVHPTDASPKVITFDARGLDRQMPLLDAACPRDTAIMAAAPETVMVDLGAGKKVRLSADQVLANHVLVEGRLEQRPYIIYRPALTYPDLLRQTGVQGRVIVQGIIDTMGRAEPGSVQIVKTPHVLFNQQARDFMLHAVFRPARFHGKAVRVLVNVPLDFKIGERPLNPYDARRP